MKDPWNPSSEKIRNWAYSDELIPDQDWELAVVDTPENQRLCLTLAADLGCPKRQFFLGCLYVFTGDTITDKVPHPIEELNDLLQRAAYFTSSEEIRLWRERSIALIQHPGNYTYEYWGLYSRFVYDRAPMNMLSEFWRKRTIPTVNGLVFPNNMIRSVRSPDLEQRVPYTLSIDEKDIPFEPADYFQSSIHPEHEFTDITTGIRAVVGEGSSGGDGFVALFSRENFDEPVWVAVFDFSNPFVKVRLEDGVVLAQNNNQETWRFPVSGIGQIVIT